MTETTAQGQFPGSALSRNALVAALAIAGLTNALAPRMVGSVLEVGWYNAVLSTFDISAVVWISCVLLLDLLISGPAVPLGQRDRAVALACGLAFVVPLGQLSWVALTLLSLYLGLTSASGSALRRAALLLFMLTLPTFWLRLVMAFASGPLLHLDAVLVATLVGQQAVHNTVPFADGSGTLWIAPPCSSALNVLLTLLCGVAFATANGLRWSWRFTGWTVVALLGVVAVNTGRLAMLALFPSHFSTLHGAEGAAVFSLLIFVVMIGTFWLAVRHERTYLA